MDTYRYKDINYLLSKKDNNKNTYLKMRMDGTIIVSTNKKTKLKDVELLIETNYDKIKNAQLICKQQLKALFIPEGFVYYLGKKYDFKANIGTRNTCTNQFEITYSDESNIEKIVKKQINTMALDIAKQRSLIYQEKLSRHFGYEIDVSQIKIKDMATRWGVCHVQKKQISYATMLFYEEISIVDCVVLHELCHLIYPNHSKQFYNLIEMFIPDYKTKMNKLSRKEC